MANIILFTDIGPRNNREFTVKNGEGYIGLEYFNRPSGAYVLASFLRKLGYSVVVLSGASRMSFAGIKDFVNRNSKDLLWVGISTSFYHTKSEGIYKYREQWANTTDLFCDKKDIYTPGTNPNTPTELLLGSDEVNLISDYLKDTFKNVPLLIGGAWVTHINNGNLHGLRDNIYIVTGYAEKYVEKISQELKNKKNESLILQISNTSYDDHGFKDSTIDYTTRDHISKDEWLPIEISRGCAFDCAYCSFDRKSTTDSYKNSTVLRNELIKNYELYGVTKYLLLDDLYNDNKTKVRKLHDEVWSRLPFTPEWVSYMRLDMIWADPDSAKIMMDSGCKLGYFGIETLHDRAGKKIGKGLGKQRILDTLKHCKDVWGDEVFVSGMFIMGLPYEPVEHMLETSEWLKTTDLLHCYTINPLWVTPPSNRGLVAMRDRISTQNEKFGIRWDHQGWVHDQTNHTQARQITNDCMNALPHSIAVGSSEYSELRSIGFTHMDIIDRKNNPNFKIQIQQRLADMNYRVDCRFKNCFSHSD